MNVISTELEDHDFKTIRRLVYDLSGINLKESKKALVRARLMKRLRALKLGSIKEYIQYLDQHPGSQESRLLIDAITTNKTSFFREPEHFEYLSHKVLPSLRNSRLRFWTTACSSGEEPVSLAILLRENIPDIESKDVRILATDISMEMLEIARRAIYGKEALEGIPQNYLLKYFSVRHKGSLRYYQAKKNIRSLIKLAWLNLVDSWPMKGPFNVIFCRNVMIYFDKPTQQKLIIHDVINIAA